MGVNSLLKTVTGRDCDLNPGPSAPESSTLTTRLPSNLQGSVTYLRCSVAVNNHTKKDLLVSNRGCILNNNNNNNNDRLTAFDPGQPG